MIVALKLQKKNFSLKTNTDKFEVKFSNSLNLNISLFIAGLRGDTRLNPTE